MKAVFAGFLKNEIQFVFQVSLSLPSAELSSKLGWVPSFVVKALGYRDDWGLRAKVLELLDAYIVPKRKWSPSSVLDSPDTCKRQNIYQTQGIEVKFPRLLINIFCRQSVPILEYVSEGS